MRVQRKKGDPRVVITKHDGKATVFEPVQAAAYDAAPYDFEWGPMWAVVTCVWK